MMNGWRELCEKKRNISVYLIWLNGWCTLRVWKTDLIVSAEESWKVHHNFPWGEGKKSDLCLIWRENWRNSFRVLIEFFPSAHIEKIHALFLTPFDTAWLLLKFATAECHCSALLLIAFRFIQSESHYAFFVLTNSVLMLRDIFCTLIWVQWGDRWVYVSRWSYVWIWTCISEWVPMRWDEGTVDVELLRKWFAYFSDYFEIEVFLLMNYGTAWMTGLLHKGVHRYAWHLL